MTSTAPPLSYRLVAVAPLLAVVAGAATGAITTSVSASILVGLATLAAALVTINALSGRMAPREALLLASTSVLPVAVFIASAALAIGGSTSFDADSQWIAGLAGAAVLLLGIVARHHTRHQQHPPIKQPLR